MKTSELTGAALDWAVAKCEGYIDDCNSWAYQLTPDDLALGNYKPSTNWSQGGPIIERENIDLRFSMVGSPNRNRGTGCNARINYVASGQGPTPLIAAMRCYVASKLGDEVDVPAELS